MAKIYETKEDFERDKLTEQAKNLRLSASHEAGWGAVLISGSFLTDLLTKSTGGWRVLSSALSVMGIIEAIKSLFTGSKAHTLELERDRMGPAKVVMPPDTVIEEHKDCHCHSKLHKHAVSPKTLLEQAERTGLPAMRE